MQRIWQIILLTALSLLAPVTEALACATCRPNPDDPITFAADMSVVFLGGLVMCILALFSSFFVYLWHRNRNPLIDPAQLIAEAPADGDPGLDAESFPARV